MSRWFRFYDGTLDDPKAQRLPPVLFKAWVNLLCLASRNDGNIPIGDVAFALRLTDEEAVATIDQLVAAGLVDEFDGLFAPHNWDGRQFKSDVVDPTAAERMRRYRSKHRNGDHSDDRNGDRNGDRNASVTVTVPRAETEQNRTDNSSLRSEARKRATRIPPDWQPEIESAKSEGLSESEIQRQAARFRDYWQAKSGKDATKLDWSAVWRNWCRKTAEDKGLIPPSTAGPNVVQIGFYAAFESRELDAWAEWERATGKHYPRDKRGGWNFPTRWPPGHEPQAETG